MAGPSFHTGEETLQARAGSRERLAEVGPRVIRPAMPETHQTFFGQLPFVVAGAVDGAGQPWASLLAGAPGFITAPADDRLRIAALPPAGDPLEGLLQAGARVGLLGIEAHTRRRNRANGRVVAVDGVGIDIHVEQSFGNCPKYIEPRQAEYAPGQEARPESLDFTGLGDPVRTLVAAADTFFIASAHPDDDGLPAHGVDVSHRGGPAGFVRIDGDTLTVPDLAGNNYFNTLGNLLLAPRAGLLFIDFARGDLAWLAADAEIVDDAAALAAFPEARRLLRLHVRTSRLARRAAALRWQPPPA
ncbi:pyridoxamine 5'-phosphate oxidase family protein [Zoogloea sp.]|uniref:pyridoxamine 5'-phosphate oxidase family protein n=1 Tax=Zoogloea sp. TaxID=49181 RepID=UPI0035AEAF4D